MTSETAPSLCPEPGTHLTNHRIPPEFPTVTAVRIADFRFT